MPSDSFFALSPFRLFGDCPVMISVVMNGFSAFRPFVLFFSALTSCPTRPYNHPSIKCKTQKPLFNRLHSHDSPKTAELRPKARKKPTKTMVPLGERICRFPGEFACRPPGRTSIVVWKKIPPRNKSSSPHRGADCQSAARVVHERPSPRQTTRCQDPSPKTNAPPTRSANQRAFRRLKSPGLPPSDQVIIREQFADPAGTTPPENPRFP